MLVRLALSPTWKHYFLSVRTLKERKFLALQGMSYSIQALTVDVSTPERSLDIFRNPSF